MRTDERLMPPAVIVRQVEEISRFATLYGPGLLMDPRLEAMLLQVAAKELPSINLRRKVEGRRRLLHVVTEVFEVGGHTRVLDNWISLDRRSEHSVIFTKQKSKLPEWLRFSLSEAGAHVHFLSPELSSLESGRRLREFTASQKWSAIVLHHHMNDAAPALAFSEAGDIPIIIYNHADHLHWLGVSIADLIIDFSPKRMEYSRIFRKAKRGYLLPYPLGNAVPCMDAKEFRYALGLASSDVMLVSMGNRYKFCPHGEYDFLAVMAQVLKACPQSHLYVIGLSRDDYAQFSGSPFPSNLHCVGELSNPVNYCAAADLFVEPFPIGTGLGVFDVCRFGATPLFAFGDMPTVYGEGCIDLFGGSGVETRLGTEQEYRTYLVDLILDSKKRKALGERVENFINERCVGQGWIEELERMYLQVQKIDHQVAVPIEENRGTDRNFREFHRFACRDFLSPLMHAITLTSFAVSLSQFLLINWWFLRGLPFAVHARRTCRGLGFSLLFRFNVRTMRRLVLHLFKQRIVPI